MIIIYESSCFIVVEEDGDYYPLTDGGYIVSKEYMNWTVASIWCQDRKAKLAIVTTDREEKTLKEMLFYNYITKGKYSMTLILCTSSVHC